MNVDIERIYELKAELNKINSADIKDIVFLEGGKPIEVDSALLDTWAIVGLNNTDFITTDFYLGSEID